MEPPPPPPPPPPRPASSSPERAGPSALGDVGRGLGVEHLDKADEDEMTEVPSDAADAPKKGQRREEATIVEEEVPEKGRNNRFVPIKDVKGMLQTGHFEGVKVDYCTKKDKSCLLSGVIHGISYFCTCADCDQKGKALSARGFEQHALKGSRHETSNANDHIVFSSSNLSLFEACHWLKGAKSKKIEDDVFENIKKAIGFDVCKTYTNLGTRHEEERNVEDKVDPILKRLERIEERLELLENLQSQVTSLEKSVDCIVGEMVRYQKLFGELSETLGKFGNI